MKRIRVITAVLALFALTSALAFAHDTTITLTQENNSGQNGTAVLTDMEDGTTKVTVDISGGSEVAQPAHIHEGQCDPTLNPRPAYPLTSVVNGKSETIVPVDLHDLTDGTYAINIHKSAAEASVYVSCGNIVATTEHGDEGSPGMPRTGGAGMLPLGLLALLGLAMAGSGLVLARRKA
jgi:Cu/Zn superoxide dismutase